MNWLLGGVGVGGVWIGGVIYFTWWLRRPPKRPAGGEPPAVPRSGARSPLPGFIPPAPASHSCGGTARLIDIRRSGCIWVWRQGYGWQQAAVCVPSDEAWDEWLNSLPLEDK